MCFLASMATALRLPLLFKKQFPQSASHSSAHITHGTNEPWEPIGPAPEHLLSEMRRMYWESAKAELEAIILTLRAWQQPDFQDVKVDEEDDTFVHGFDTFIDQVSEQSRAFAARYGAERERLVEVQKKRQKGYDAPAAMEYREALRHRRRDVAAEKASAAIKAGVRAVLQDYEQDSLLERRARMLLQSAGFLDIDKLIEHRPPLDNLSFWKRPGIPQLMLSRFDTVTWFPELTGRTCPNCSMIIRGSIFRGANKEGGTKTICEECYRKSHYGETGLQKMYKYCVLPEVINPAASRNLCKCDTVPHFDASGRSRCLFPVDEGDNHRDYGGRTGLQCGLLKLPEIIAEAKYAAMQGSGRTVRPLSEEKRQRELKRRKEEEKVQAKVAKETTRIWKEERKIKKRPGQNFTKVTESSLSDATERTSERGSTLATIEPEADGDIPFFIRRYTNKYPFGNVHMALRVGPLLIENGVEQ